MAETDTQMALSIHHGEPGGIDRLVLAYQDALFTYALRLMRDRDEAFDLTQETFIRAYRALMEKHTESAIRTLPLRPWLFRIIRNLGLNRLRDRRRRDAALGEVALQIDTGVPEHSPELIVQLDRALKQLSRQDSELIVLRFTEGLSYAEMVSVCNLTEAAIRGKVFRAVRKLRTIMEKEVPDAL